MKQAIFAAAALILAAFNGQVMAADPTPDTRKLAPEERSNVPPLMERYILDELKSLRGEVLTMKANVKEELVTREIGMADRAINYSMSATTVLFYVVAIGGAIMALVGWRSVKDLKNSARVMAEKEISRLSSEYEERLSALESELKEKSRIITENRLEIEKTQTVHSMWLQAHQTPTPRGKIELYDRILELTPGDPEVMAHKADAALQLGDRDWAISLCNRVIAENPDMGLAHYQRACAYAGLGETDIALADLRRAIELAGSLREQARFDEELESLHGMPEFLELVRVTEEETAAAA